MNTPFKHLKAVLPPWRLPRRRQSHRVLGFAVLSLVVLGGSIFALTLFHAHGASLTNKNANHAFTSSVGTATPAATTSSLASSTATATVQPTPSAGASLIPTSSTSTGKGLQATPTARPTLIPTATPTPMADCLSLSTSGLTFHYTPGTLPPDPQSVALENCGGPQTYWSGFVQNHAGDILVSSDPATLKGQLNNGASQNITFSVIPNVNVPPYCYVDTFYFYKGSARVSLPITIYYGLSSTCINPTI